jgi:CheY-like chemotaxis protein
VRVLLADGDGSRSKGLASVLADAGHVVDRAVHGAAALEVALARAPKVVICAGDLPVIDGARLAEILRGNPRTRGARFIFLVDDELDAPLSIHLEDQIVIAPWRDHDVLRALGEEAAASDKEEASGVEGNLAQLSLSDLLQMFHLGRKSGALRLMPEGAAAGGVIELDTGQIAAATLDLGGDVVIEGEKALFRLMRVRRGRFAFVRGALCGEVGITRPTRELLFEAARQLDEWERVAALLPDREARLVLSSEPERQPAADHPLVREVLAAIEQFGRVGDVLDRCPVPDAQVARVLQRLIQQNAVAVRLPGEPVPGEAEPDGIFTPSQLRRLREWLSMETSRPSGVLKVAVVPVDPGVLVDFVSALRDIPEFRAEDGAVTPASGLGRLGHFPAAQGIEVSLVAVPIGAVYEPVWGVLGHGMLGAMVLLRTSLVASLPELERVVAGLRQISDRPIIPVVESSSTAPTLGEPERREIERLGDAPLFVLPTDFDPARRGVLQNLFARLVP